MSGDAILIWGAGAIGGTIGAYLARAGHQIVFVDIVPEHVAAIAGPGLATRSASPTQSSQGQWSFAARRPGR